MGLDALPGDGAEAAPAATDAAVTPSAAASTTTVSGTSTAPAPGSDGGAVSGPVGASAGANATGSTAAGSGAPARPRRLWDSVLTAILLGIGIVSVTSSIPQYADFPATMNLVLAQLGYGEYTQVGLATTVGIALNVTQIVLYVASATIALMRIRKGKLGFFYPLIAAAIFFVVMVVLLVVVFSSDPSLLSSITSGS
jgi:hypothetical protein